MACELCTWAINQRGKTLVRNLMYGPQTRLVRGMYCTVKPSILYMETTKLLDTLPVATELFMVLFSQEDKKLKPKFLFDPLTWI